MSLSCSMSPLKQPFIGRALPESDAKLRDVPMEKLIGIAIPEAEPNLKDFLTKFIARAIAASCSNIERVSYKNKL